MEIDEIREAGGAIPVRSSDGLWEKRQSSKWALALQTRIITQPLVSGTCNR